MLMFGQEIVQTFRLEHIPPKPFHKQLLKKLVCHSLRMPKSSQICIPRICGELSKNHIPMLQTCFKYPDVNPHQMVDAQLHLYPKNIHNLKSRWCLVPNGSIFCPSWSVEGSWPSISTFECSGTTFSCQLGIFHSDLKGTPLKESKHGHLGKKYSDWKTHYCWWFILIQPSKSRIPTSSCSWFRNPAFNQLIWRIYKLFRFSLSQVVLWDFWTINSSSWFRPVHQLSLPGMTSRRRIMRPTKGLVGAGVGWMYET